MCQNSIPLFCGQSLKSPIAWHTPSIQPRSLTVSMYLCVYLPLPLHLNLSSNWPFYAHEHTLDIISISRAISVAKQFITNYAHSVSSCWWQRVTSTSAPSCCCQLQLGGRFSPQLQVLCAARGRATAAG